MHFANIRHSTTPHIYHLLKRPLKFYLINETKKDGMKRSASAKQQVETTTDRTFYRRLSNMEIQFYIKFL